MAKRRKGSLIPIAVGLTALATFIVISKMRADAAAKPYLGTIYPPAPPSSFHSQAATMQPASYD